jgi:hypothetical protein
MKEQKHIDRLFQEKLKDFEATPSNAVWENINAELHSDNKARKIIPLWIRLSGIAAALLLLFTIGNAVFNTINENPEQDTIVDTNNSSDTDINEMNKVSKDDIINLNNNILETEHIVAEGSENKLKTEPLNNASKTTKVTDNNSYASKNALVNSKQNTSNILKDDNPVNQNLKTTDESTKTAVVQNNTGVSKNKKSITSNTLEKADTKNVKSNAVVQNTKSDAVIDKNKTIENAVAKTVLDETNNSADNIEDTIEKETIGADEKTSIEDALVENVKQDEKKKKNKLEDRWKVSPSIAPVYFNTLGAGSSIHEQFNQNTKTGDVNMSYGVRGSYALTEKLSVRAGVNKVTLGYSTDDVFMLNNVTSTPTDARFALRNVDLIEEAQNTSFVSVEEFNFAQVPSVLSDQIIGSIDQKLGFIEVPLELEYEVSSQKLGLRVLGGFSALFLNENEVYSTLDSQTILIGQATNINKTSFTANLGVGMDFKLSEKFKLNLEPTFKYQLNTFNNTSGDFKPYFIGIYSGFSFKF